MKVNTIYGCLQLACVQQICLPVINKMLHVVSKRSMWDIPSEVWILPCCNAVWCLIYVYFPNLSTGVIKLPVNLGNQYHAIAYYHAIELGDVFQDFPYRVGNFHDLRSDHTTTYVWRAGEWPHRLLRKEAASSSCLRAMYRIPFGSAYEVSRSFFGGAFIFPSAFIYLIYLKSLHLISRELPYPTWGKEIVHRLKSAFLKEDIFCQSVPRKVPPIPNNPCDWYISRHLP